MKLQDFRCLSTFLIYLVARNSTGSEPTGDENDITSFQHKVLDKSFYKEKNQVEAGLSASTWKNKIQD